VRRVAGDQLQAVRDGHGRDHWIATAYRPSNAIQVAGDQPSQIGRGLIEREDLLRGDGVAKGLDAARTADPG
jgi:hypothetical protein